MEVNQIENQNGENVFSFVDWVYMNPDHLSDRPVLKEPNLGKEKDDVFDRDVPDLFASTANETSFDITVNKDGPSSPLLLEDAADMLNPCPI